MPRQPQSYRPLQSGPENRIVPLTCEANPEYIAVPRPRDACSRLYPAAIPRVDPPTPTAYSVYTTVRLLPATYRPSRADHPTLPTGEGMLWHPPRPFPDERPEPSRPDWLPSPATVRVRGQLPQKD